MITSIVNQYLNQHQDLDCCCFRDSYLVTEILCSYTAARGGSKCPKEFKNFRNDFKHLKPSNQIGFGGFDCGH
jgi:hypothetical protein